MSHFLLDPTDPALRGETSIVLATLVAASGSSSKKVGAKMIVGASGKLLGGVTIGGCVDAQVIDAADRMTDGGNRTLLSVSLDDDEAWEIGLTCGGRIDVLLERVCPADPADPVIVAHQEAAALLARGESAAIITPLEGSTAPRVVAEDAVRDAGAVDERVFVDHLAPPLTLIIVGAGEIAMSLTHFGRALDMRSIVVDGRERYATKARFPDADSIRVGMPSEIVAELAPGKNTAVLLVAHDYKYELPVLRQLLRTPLGYLGLLGSRKRGGAVRDMLRDEGFSDDEIARIHTPIGLDLGGKQSAEVALAILAEIVAIRNGKRV